MVAAVMELEVVVLNGSSAESHSAVWRLTRCMDTLTGRLQCCKLAHLPASAPTMHPLQPTPTMPPRPADGPQGPRAGLFQPV